MVSSRQAMKSPEWECGEVEEKTEMGGLISKGVWIQCPRPKGNVVLGTKRLYSRKIEERGEVVNQGTPLRKIAFPYTRGK